MSSNGFFSTDRELLTNAHLAGAFEWFLVVLLIILGCRWVKGVYDERTVLRVNCNRQHQELIDQRTLIEHHVRENNRLKGQLKRPVTAQVDEQARVPKERVIERLPVALETAMRTLAAALDERISRTEELRTRLIQHESILKHSREAQRLSDELKFLPSASLNSLTDDVRVCWVARALQSEAILSDTLGLEILHALIRTQREASSFPLEESLPLLRSLAKEHGLTVMMPSVGARFDRVEHQPGGASKTSAAGDLTVRRILAIGLKEVQSGLVETRATVEVG